MGDFLGKLFVAVEELPNDGYGFVQVCFLGAIYLYILLIGANMIGDGSELLLLIPSLAGVVGSVVLPILGAVPDGAIVLFSGLGDDAAQQINVGVGALAGSTVMLLTVPWFLSIVGGRVALGPVRGQTGLMPQYGKKGLEVPAGLKASGVAPDSSIRKSAVVMLITCLPCYLIVEIPALIFMNESAATAASDIKPFAWTGVFICLFLFIGYIAYQYKLANECDDDSSSSSNTANNNLLQQRVNDIMVKAIKDGHMGLRGLLKDFMPVRAATNGDPLLEAGPREEWQLKLQRIVRPFFNKFDSDGNGTLDKHEMANLVHTLGEHITPAEVEEIFKETDTDGSGEIDFKEFSSFLTQLVQKERQPARMVRAQTTSARQMSTVPAEQGQQMDAQDSAASAEDDDDDDEPEVPEDILAMHLSPEEQQSRVLRRACWQMGIGTLIVLLFSDPMVDVLDNVGTRTGIPPFFVAFLLGPIASNASEMVASYKYAQKKSEKTISVAFSQLLGAACMNNTFCLLIFYLIIATRGFAWTYHAEVIGIVAAEVIMALMATKRVHTMLDAWIVLSFLPFTLVIVGAFKATVFKKVEG